MLQCGLAISITALTVLGMAIRWLRRTLLNPGNAIALARRSARLNIRASEALRARLLHIPISAKLLVGVAVLSRPTPATPTAGTAKPPPRVVLARAIYKLGWRAKITSVLLGKCSTR